MDKFSSDNHLLWYIGIIIVFFAFFIWNNMRLKRNRNDRKNRHFKKRYMDRKSNQKE